MCIRDRHQGADLITIHISIGTDDDLVKAQVVQIKGCLLYTSDTLETNYMPYAMSVIVSRALPEIDGFKPAHGKLLYTMYGMGLLKGARTKREWYGCSVSVLSLRKNVLRWFIMQSLVKRRSGAISLLKAIRM